MTVAKSREQLDAVAFARQYVALVDALLKEGVDEFRAREEARLAAISFVVERGYETGGTPCALCGR